MTAENIDRYEFIDDWKPRFEKIDRPAMLLLPETPYQYAEWSKARVHLDFHIEVDHHFYSDPYRLVREQVVDRLPRLTLYRLRTVTHLPD